MSLRSWKTWAAATAILAWFVPVSGMYGAAASYEPHPDSRPQADVPKGELLEFAFAESKIFPGTTRKVSVFVPRQYDPAKPACTFICQDGIRWNGPTVLENLIGRREIPVTIGIFVTPGVLPSRQPEAALERFNRSYEYDGMSDNYARFLLEELLPFVESKQTADGRPIRLSRSGNDRAIAGQSSGAAAAFTAAWERPGEFSRVFSAIGSYTGLRGAEDYATLVRKFEPKPIRVFLQDGSNDQNIYSGDWWMANQQLRSALTYAGYDVAHAWGEGGHSGDHATSIFPDALRWLWKDWPKPIRAGVLPVERIRPFLIPGEEWTLVVEGLRSADAPAVNAAGEVYFNDPAANKGFKVGVDGTVTTITEDCQRASGQAFAADGRRFSVSGNTPRVVVYDPAGAPSVLVEGVRGNDVVVARNGNVYFTQSPPATSNEPSKVFLLSPGSSAPREVDVGIRFANGIVLSPDQSLLYVSDFRSHWVYSFQILADGTLANKQRYFHLHRPDWADDAGPDGMRVDREGRLYVATRFGIQVCDQAGRVNVIVPTPNRRVSNLVFGGPKFDVLYATCGDKVYRRKLAATGANAWDAPNKPAPPRL